MRIMHWLRCRKTHRRQVDDACSRVDQQLDAEWLLADAIERARRDAHRRDR